MFMIYNDIETEWCKYCIHDDKSGAKFCKSCTKGYVLRESMALGNSYATVITTTPPSNFKNRSDIYGTPGNSQETS